MLFIPKIDHYLKILTDEEVNDLVVINFSEYSKFKREKLYSKLSQEQNLRKVAESLYILLVTPDKVEKYRKTNFSDKCVHRYNVEILNLFDPELLLINTKSLIKNKLKELLTELKIQKILTFRQY